MKTQPYFLCLNVSSTTKYDKIRKSTTTYNSLRQTTVFAKKSPRIFAIEYLIVVNFFHSFVILRLKSGGFIEKKMNVKKVLIGTAIAAVVGYLIYKGTQKTIEAKAFVDQLNFNIKLGKIAIQNKKLVIKLNIEFINPTKLSVSFEKPTVQIKYNGSVLAQSKISKDIVTIKPQGMSVINDMTFEIPILSLKTVSLFADMLSKAGEGFKFNKNAKLKDNITNLINTLSNNVLTKLLPLLEVAMVVYVGDIAIPYSTKLA